MSDPVTLQALLSTGADTAAAIGAPARTPLTHGELRALIEDVPPGGRVF